MENMNPAFTHQAYVLRAITHMHPGSGDIEYGIIDKTVQRDPVTHYPTIHSSSLKGAIREHFKDRSMAEEEITKVFGSEVSAKTSDKMQAGSYRFFGADLLSLPVRASSVPYVQVTCPSIVKATQQRLNTFGFQQFDDALKWLAGLPIPADKALLLQEQTGLRLEELATENLSPDNMDQAHLEQCTALFGAPLALVSNDQMKEWANNLPVLARNQLENGISGNLWYEQIVPRETRFLSLVSVPTKAGTPALNLKQEPIQVGANASIGYGLTEFTLIN